MGPIAWDARVEAAVRAAVDAAMADGATPGVAVAITDRERTLFTAGFGYADLAGRRPVGVEDLFEIGSIGKSFTALCLMALAEEGRLDPTDPVVRHLPWFQVPPAAPDAPPITLHHLLTHTAGIVAGIDATPEPAAQVWALRDMRPSAAPGTRSHYSNVGYKVLGLVLEALEGRPYPETLRRRVLDPLGMRASEPEITNAIRPRMAVGYTWADDERIGHPGVGVVPATWLETATADGSIAATAGDMARYARLLLGRGTADGARIVGEDAFDRMTAPHVELGPGASYGYGLATRSIDGRTYLGHGGGMVGYLAGIQVDPNAGIGAVVLQSGYGAGPVTLARQLVALVAGATLPEQPAADGSAIAGAWVRAPADSAGAVVAAAALEIEADDAGAVLAIDGDRVRLSGGGDAWFAPHPRLDRHLLTLDRGSDGHGEPELWHGGVRYVRDGATPRSLPAPDPRLAACVGTFRSHTPWTTNFTVVLRGDRLWLTFPEPPDSAEAVAPLVALDDGTFRIGDDPGGPERLAFDTQIDGRPARALLSGWPYYRTR